MIKPAPIKNKEEAKKVMDILIRHAVRTLKIERGEAKKRIENIINSGVLDQFESGQNPAFMMIVDTLMQVPSDVFHAKTNQQ